MKDMKLSNIQKESEKIKIKKNINDCEDLKAQILLKLGIITFDKIRKGEIIDNDFDILCEEIKNLDIEIYKKYMQLRSFEKEIKKNICKCGYVAFKNEKFCPQCGKNLVEDEKLYITCPYCNQETEKDSNFCACCGSKVKQEFTHYEDEVYCIDEEVSSEEYIFEEEIPKVGMIEEDFGKEFLNQQEELVREDDTIINEDSAKKDIIEMEGREFLKNHQNQIEE